MAALFHTDQAKVQPNPPLLPTTTSTTTTALTPPIKYPHGTLNAIARSSVATAPLASAGLPGPPFRIPRNPGT
ncbi:unnamed protein product [Merluccius merluccius]